jgi:hypothetical protein
MRIRYGTFEWISLIINKMPKHDIFLMNIGCYHEPSCCIILASFGCINRVIISALVFAWERLKRNPCQKIFGR